MQIRLLDFNPVGGAISPLLFTWEELGYPVGSSDKPELDHPQSLSAEALSAQQDLQPATESHADALGPISTQRESPPEAASHSTNGQADSASASPESRLQLTARAADMGTENGNGHGNGDAAEQAGILVRFAEPGSSMLRPASALYGAPYDMADLSEGSAISEMLRKMQTQEQKALQEQGDK